MCQIQFLMNLKGNLSQKDVLQFCKLMNQGSAGNPDSFGVFNSKASFRKAGSFKSRELENMELLSDTFLVGHNRKATAGDPKDNQNNHPFDFGDFLLVHNGMINNHDILREMFAIPNKPETDSFVILWLINHFFDESKASSRHKRIMQAIKQACSKLSGWYSVFLFDKATRNLYYFRNRHARFVFAMFDEDVIAGTTDESNLENIYVNGQYIFNSPGFKKRAFAEPEAETIYLINDAVKIQKAGEFKDGDDAPMPTGNCGYSEIWSELPDDGIIYEQCIMEWLTERLGYCPEMEVSRSGSLRIKADQAVMDNIDLMCSDYTRKGKWLETSVECLYGIEEYLYDWH